MMRIRHWGVIGGIFFLLRVMGHMHKHLHLHQHRLRYASSTSWHFWRFG